MALRVIFMGTPDFSVPTLRRLVADGHQVVAVYTRAPKPAGRGMEPQPTPVEKAARELGLTVLTPKTLRDPAAQAEFAAFNADVAVVVAYGLILPKPVLDAPRLGCFNGHASLLPRWRGAAPIQRAIMAGDEETGVMVMQMEEGLDTGPVALTARLPILPDMTAAELHDALSLAGAELLGQAMAQLEAGTLATVTQPEAGVTYAHKIEKTESRIDFSLSAQAVHDHIRSLSPFPGAWFELPAGKDSIRIKVLRSALESGTGEAGTALDDALTIACGSGAIRLVEIQRAGKGPMKAADFLRGTPVPAGTRLAQAPAQ